MSILDLFTVFNNMLEENMNNPFIYFVISAVIIPIFVTISNILKFFLSRELDYYDKI